MVASYSNHRPDGLRFLANGLPGGCHEAASENSKAADNSAAAGQRYVALTAKLVEVTEQSTELARLAINPNRP
jgi:hypothetical protein